MTTFREEALPELNYENKLSSFCRFTLLPHLNTGNFLKNIVTNEIKQVNRVDKIGGIAWNNNGSISYPTAPNGREFTNYSGIDDVLEPEIEIRTKEIILIAEVSVSNNKYHNNNQPCLVGIENGWQNRLGIYKDKWKGISFVLQVDGISYNYLMQGYNFDGIKTFAMHYNPSNNTAYCYMDGNLISTLQSLKAFTKKMTHYKIAGMDKNYSFYMGNIINGSLSTEEVATFIADPYSIFKTEEDENTEYAIRCDGLSKQFVHWPLEPLKRFELDVLFSPDSFKNNKVRFLKFYDVQVQLSAYNGYEITANATRGTHKTGVVTAKPSLYRDTFDGTPIRLKIKVDDNENTGYRELSMWVNDVFVGASSSHSSNTEYGTSYIPGEQSLGAYNSENRSGLNYSGFLHDIKISGTDLNDKWKNYHFDFNQTTETHVNDLTGGPTLGTFTGFTANGGRQRVLQSYEYDIKADGSMDYPSLKAYFTDVKKTGVINTAIIWGKLTDSGKFIFPAWGTASSRLKHIIKAGDNAFDGRDFNANYHLPRNLMLRVRNYTDLMLKEIKGATISLGGYGGKYSILTIKSCFLIADGATLRLFDNIGRLTTLQLKNSYVRGYKSSISNRSEKLLAINNIVVNCSGYGPGQAFGKRAVCKNNITHYDAATNSWNSYNKGFNLSSLGSNNISSDSSSVDAGVGIQVDLTNAFNEQGMLKSDFAKTHLTGSGWNGSNICEWSWDEVNAATIGLAVVTAKQVNNAFNISITKDHNLAVTVARQLNQTLQVLLSQQHLINMPIVEQKNKSHKMNLFHQHVLNITKSKQKNKVVVGTISQSHLIGLVIAQQLNNALNVNVDQLRQLTSSVAVQTNITMTPEISKIHNLGVVSAEQLNKVLSITIGQVHGLLTNVTEQYNKSLLQEIIKQLSFQLVKVEQKNTASTNFVVQLHELDESIAEQFNKGIPAYLISSLIENIDSEKLVLINLTQECFLTQKTKLH